MNEPLFSAHKQADLAAAFLYRIRFNLNFAGLSVVRLGVFRAQSRRPRDKLRRRENLPRHWEPRWELQPASVGSHRRQMNPAGSPAGQAAIWSAPDPSELRITPEKSPDEVEPFGDGLALVTRRDMHDEVAVGEPETELS
jgi:hypothetical protein